MPNVIFIRHAQTNFNAEGKFSGQAEALVTEEGLIQTTEKFKNFDKSFDCIYCSPLKRTKQTLEAIIPNANAIIDERIIETNLGLWTGAIKTEINPEELAQFRAGNFTPPEGEKREDVEARVLDFVKDLFDKYKNNERILVVTHAGIIKALEFRFFGKKQSRVENLEMLEIDNKVFNDFIKKEESKWK